MALKLFLALFATAGYALLVNVPRRLLLPAALGGMLSWGVYLLLKGRIESTFYLLVLVGAAALLPKTAEADTAVSAEGAALSAKLKTNEDRVALLTACGWSVESEPVGTQEVQIPDTFDEVYEQYNAIQQAQGLDLTPYQGKRATLYTYALTAYPTGEQGVTANLLVRRNRLIAADITSAQTDGFVHGLLDMPQI